MHQPNIDGHSVIDMTVEKEIGGTVYKIRDDLTLGELSQIQDEAVEIDSRTMLTLTKVEKIRVYHELRKIELELPCDMLVLTTPLIPSEDNQEISKMLKVSLDEFGFFLEAHLKLRPVEFAMDGIYICGSAR